MSKILRLRVSLLVLMCCSSCCVTGWAQQPTGTEQKPETDEAPRVSRFGEYSGYSIERFSQWHSTSQYIEMPDGVKLAVDIVRPSVEGIPVDEKLPVIWTHSRYHRNPSEMIKHFGGDPNVNIQSSVDVIPDLQRLLKHGYCFVAVGVRGSGASFGRFSGLVSQEETDDAYNVMEWISKQPWCDGNIGMHGVSYLGMTQYMAASKSHPALKAIFPNLAAFDLYDTVYPGGVFRQDMVQHWDQLTETLDLVVLAPSVGTDPDKKQLMQAVAGHQKNWNVAQGYRAVKFRDSIADGASYETHNLRPALGRINQAKIPAYHWGGWYDIFVKDTLRWYANYEGPQKLAIGSWPHAESTDPRVMENRIRLRSAEQHRWFDYWLKGIDNGIMNEAPINIGTLHDPGDERWSALQRWPVPASKQQTFFFTGGIEASANSVNDGGLQTIVPTELNLLDVYTINRETTTGSASRWDNAVGAGTMDYPDMSQNDAICLTYTTEPLSSDVNVTGHPVATLYVESDASDADFHVLLEEIDAAGKSHYISEGVLRASNRAESMASWNNLGLPFHRGFKSDQTLLPSGVPTRLRLDLLPVSNVFNEGHRIRIAIMGADKDNTESSPVENGTKVRIHRSKEFASQIALPVLAKMATSNAGKPWIERKKPQIVPRDQRRPSLRSPNNRND